MTTALSVNLNKIALLRNARGGQVPSVIRAAETCIAAGCQGLTLHPRPDQRHARPQDCRDLRFLEGVELNLEGNPFEGPQGSYPGFLNLVREVRPEQCTMVPDAPDQLTSDHGWNLEQDGKRLAPIIAELRAQGIRVSLFVDASNPQVELAAECGADRVELYTGPYAEAFSAHQPEAQLPLYQSAARRALDAGLGVNAGHDLDQQNLLRFLRAVPGVAEVSIGHALIGEALECGLHSAVSAYLDIIRRVG